MHVPDGFLDAPTSLATGAVAVGAIALSLRQAERETAEAGPALEAELLEWIRDRLAHYKCPRSIDFDPELPRLENGKLYKRLIKDRYWGDRDSRIV